MAKCETCHDTKHVLLPALGGWVPCPKCTGVGHDVEVAVSEENKAQLEWLRIPEPYRGLTYEHDSLGENAAMGKCTQISVKRLFNTLDLIHSGIFENNVFNDQLLFSTLQMTDTNLFVFACQQLALKKGLTVVPYISLNTLSDVIKNVPCDGGVKRIQEVYGVARADYVEADIIFLDATAQTTELGWSALADLLAERIRLHKSLFVFSYWGTKQLKSTGARFIVNIDGSGTKFMQMNVCELNLRPKNGATIEDSMETVTKNSIEMDSCF